MLNIKGNQSFFKQTFQLSWPIVLQNFLTASLMFLDLLMIGQLNESSVAAVGIANQIVFIFFVIQFGIHSGVSIFAAQYWGKKDTDAIKKLLGISLLTGSIVGVLFTLATGFGSKEIFSFFIKDPLVISLGSEYLWIVGTSFWIWVICIAYTYSLRSTKVVNIPLYTSSIAVALNLLLNYVLIFGHLGFPAMGVKGAAIATCVSKYVEACVLVCWVYLKKYPCAGKFSEMMGFDSKFFKKILKTCWPVFLNDLVWVTGVSLYNLVYARIGTQSIAAVNIVASFEEFVMIPFFGMFSAGSIILGNAIGERKKEDAFSYGKALLKFQFLLAVVAGGLLILSRNWILSFYNISDEAFANAYHLMMVTGLVLCLKTSNFTLIVSAFRGGGDTRFGFFLDLTGVWCIGIPMAFFAAFVLKLPVYWVMALVVSEELFKFLIALPRFRSGKWIKCLI